MENWKALGVPGGFGIHVPPGSTWALASDGTSVVVRLPTEPFTEILLSRHTGASADQRFLQGQVLAFLERVVPEVEHKRLGSSVRSWSGDGGAAVVQGVATDGHGDWWLVRAYGLGSDYFWLQWTGPKAALEEPVLEVFESFTIAGGAAVSTAS